MRLGQLARKLAIKPADILSFLSQKDIHQESDSNSRLDDDLVLLITNHFQPEKPVPVVDTVLKEDVLPLSEETGNIAVTDEVVPEQNRQEEEPTVIKAPKVELSGLKIIGKIELPESKKNAAAKEEDTSTQATDQPQVEADVSRPREKKYPRRDKPEDLRPRKNSVALQREREIQETEKRRREQTILEKEQRTKNYLKKVRTMPPTKSAKLISEATEEMSGVEDAPKTLFAKFLHWLKK